jgi:hypothetical protein
LAKSEQDFTAIAARLLRRNVLSSDAFGGIFARSSNMDSMPEVVETATSGFFADCI